MSYPHVTQFESRRLELQRELQLLEERAAAAAAKNDGRCEHLAAHRPVALESGANAA